MSTLSLLCVFFQLLWVDSSSTQLLGKEAKPEEAHKLSIQVCYGSSEYLQQKEYLQQTRYMNFLQLICECGVNWVHLYFNKSSHWWAQLLTLFLRLETWVWSLYREDPLEKGIFTHSSILAWRIPRTEEPSRFQTMGSQRIRHDWVTNTFFIYIYFSES